MRLESLQEKGTEAGQSAQQDEIAAPEPLYRHQFFQTQSKVEVAVLAKNLTEERVKVDIEDFHLLVSIKNANGAEVSCSKIVSRALLLRESNQRYS